MKGIRDFTYFDYEAFFKDKKLLFVNSELYYKYDSGQKTDEVLGLKIVCVIGSDNTSYNKDDTTNLFEKVSFKLPGVSSVNIKELTEIRPKILDVKVYGQYQNQLSITVSGFDVVSKNDSRK